MRKRDPRTTLEELASETKVLTKQRISNYEQGIRLLKANEAQLIANAFARLGKPITASYLLGIDEPKPAKVESQSQVDSHLWQIATRQADHHIKERRWKMAHERRRELIELYYKLALLDSEQSMKLMDSA